MNNDYYNENTNEDRGNGPRPTGSINRDFLKNINLMEIIPHMESEDIAKLISVVPVEMFEHVDLGEIAAHMDSEDIAKLVQVLPKEALQKMNVNEMVPHMESEDILKLMTKIFTSAS